jgi:hypothetical protein
MPITHIDLGTFRRQTELLNDTTVIMIDAGGYDGQAQALEVVTPKGQKPFITLSFTDEPDEDEDDEDEED